MFTSQQQLVLDLISEGQNIGRAAQAVGVHRNTVSNWRRNSVAYQYAWDLAHYDQVMIARDRAAGLAYEALCTLYDIIGNHHHPPGARIRAAIAILQRAETMPPPAPQPPPGYSPELPIPQCYAPEDHAPAKIENLAQSAQPDPEPAVPVNVRTEPETPVDAPCAKIEILAQSAQFSDPSELAEIVTTSCTATTYSFNDSLAPLSPVGTIEALPTCAGPGACTGFGPFDVLLEHAMEQVPATTAHSRAEPTGAVVPAHPKPI